MSNKSESGLSYLVFGAGAIGTYLGGSLALNGEQVVFLERPENVAKLREDGLAFELSEDKDEHLAKPKVAGSLEEALVSGPYEVALFALKSFDTQAALEEMAPYSADLPVILCLQNGVDNEATLAAVLGEEKVIAGTVTSAVGRREVGKIVLERKRGVGIAADHPLSEQLANSFNTANLNARLYADAAGMKWSKLLTNLIANATAAILKMSPAEIFEHPKLFNLEVAQLREALMVMHAKGLHPVDLPGTPVPALALAVGRLPPIVARPLLRRAVASGRGGKMPSFYLDLYSGRGQSEVAYLNGAVARHAEQLGIPAPVNRRLSEILTALTDGETPLETFAGHPDKLLDQLDFKT